MTNDEKYWALYDQLTAMQRKQLLKFAVSLGNLKQKNQDLWYPVMNEYIGKTFNLRIGG